MVGAGSGPSMGAEKQVGHVWGVQWWGQPLLLLPYLSNVCQQVACVTLPNPSPWKLCPWQNGLRQSAAASHILSSIDHSACNECQEDGGSAVCSISPQEVGNIDL